MLWELRFLKVKRNRRFCKVDKGREIRLSFAYPNNPDGFETASVGYGE
jgi:hypothetical protein